MTVRGSSKASCLFPAHNSFPARVLDKQGAIRRAYFLIRQGEIGSTKALEKKVVGSRVNSSNLAQTSESRCAVRV